MAERLRGRAAVAQRLRRLQAEPLCQDCAARGLVREASVPDHIVPLTQGCAVIFPVRERPVAGTRGDYRAVMRHGVSRLRRGRRHTLGIIFHDAT